MSSAPRYSDQTFSGKPAEHRHSKIMGYGTEVLAGLAKNAPPAIVYMNVYERMYERHFPDGYVDYDTFWNRVHNVLSPGERALLFAGELFGEFHNGGFAQYFSNGNYRHAHEAVRLLRRVGNNCAADYLQRAIEIVEIPDPLPAGYEYDDTDETSAALDKLEKENRPADNTARPFSNFEEPLANYIRQHPEEFA